MNLLLLEHLKDIQETKQQRNKIKKEGITVADEKEKKTTSKKVAEKKETEKQNQLQRNQLQKNSY